MNVKELNIGNYYFESGDEIQMTSKILSNILDVGGEFNWSPIPLTEEWIINFGFEQKQGWDDMIYFINGGIDIFPIESGFDFYDCDIKHVHQLQNLYFALTGEELTIKL